MSTEPRHIELSLADLVMIRDALNLLDPLHDDDDEQEATQDRCDTLEAIFDELVSLPYSAGHEFTLSAEPKEPTA